MTDLFQTLKTFNNNQDANRPTAGVVWAIRGDRVDVMVKGSSAILHHVQVVGTAVAKLQAVETSDGIRLIQTQTGRDLTRKMRSFCRQFLATQKPDGFILKVRSPSCAIRDAAVYDDDGELMEETRPGLFAGAALDRFPMLPVEDEERLKEPSVMLRFMGRLLDLRP